MAFIQKHRTATILAAILVASAALHLYRIDVPSRTVFDEAHFVTYASNYVLGQAYFDIHPPLGKMIYAMGIVAAGGAPAEFVRVVPDPAPWKLGLVRERTDYGAFPYVPLRVMSAVFGVLLVFAVFLMMRRLGAGDAAALWAAFFTAAETALLIETRLILLDGMYLSLGLLALALYWSRGRWSGALGGVLWGCALAVKFIAVVFLAPILVWELCCAPDQRKKRLAAFIGIGLVVLCGWYLVDGALFPSHEQFAVWRSLRPLENNVVEVQGVAGEVQVALIKSIYSVSGYIGDASGAADGENRAPRHTEESPWYAWPILRGMMVYERDANGEPFIVLAGNPVPWLGALLAVLASIVLILVPKAKRTTEPLNEERVVFPLLAGYVAGLLPFATIVLRSTFLYHYFPSLIFGLCLLGAGTAWGLQKIRVRSGRRAAWSAGVLVVLTVVMGFASAARFVYGL